MAHLERWAKKSPADSSMQTIEINGATVILSHVVSFELAKKDLRDGGKPIDVLSIRLSSGDKMDVAGNTLSLVHSQLKEAFGIR